MKVIALHPAHPLPSQGDRVHIGGPIMGTITEVGRIQCTVIGDDGSAHQVQTVEIEIIETATK